MLTQESLQKCKIAILTKMLRHFKKKEVRGKTTLKIKAKTKYTMILNMSKSWMIIMMKK